MKFLEGLILSLCRSYATLQYELHSSNCSRCSNVDMGDGSEGRCEKGAELKAIADSYETRAV